MIRRDSLDGLLVELLNLLSNVSSIKVAGTGLWGHAATVKV